jgi:hypothetical protein
VGGTEYIIGFEGSQALPVCPSGNCKLLTGIIDMKNVVFWYIETQFILHSKDITSVT